MFLSYGKCAVTEIVMNVSANSLKVDLMDLFSNSTHTRFSYNCMIEI